MLKSLEVLNIFRSTNVCINILTGNTSSHDKKKIQKNLQNGKVNFLIGTHALFQKNIIFKNLGMAIIDEQHKFGVKQRIELSDKGKKDCDILLMSATPIPRSLILAIYGDMDVSRLIEKPFQKENTITLSKPEEKIEEILTFVKKKYYATLNDCNNFVKVLYEKGYCSIELLDIIESEKCIETKNKYFYLIYFDKIRSEFRDEKLLMFLILNLFFMRKNLNLENILEM